MTKRLGWAANARLYFYSAHVVKAYDGDSITVRMDFGKGLQQEPIKLRWAWIDAPEMKNEEREAGLVSRDFVRGLMLNDTVLIRTHLDRWGIDREGKYGRLLAEVFDQLEPDGPLVNINQEMVRVGLARFETYGDNSFMGWTEL